MKKVPPAQHQRGLNKIIFTSTGLLILAVLIVASAMSVGRWIESSAAKSIAFLLEKPLAGVRVVDLNPQPPLVDMMEKSITWQSVAARVTLDQGHELLAGRSLDIRMEDLAVRADDLLSGRFVITANAISITVLGPKSPSALTAASGMTTLKKGRLQVPLHLELWPLSGIGLQVEALVRDLLGLVRHGATSVPLEFAGISSFRINKEVVKAELGVRRRDGRTSLVMDKESLKIISWVMEETLTDPEVALLSANPIKAPRLLRIRNEARKVARQAHQEQRLIPEDAYRHVLWSYLLAEAYGQEFAKAVTDAHEQGKTDNTESEHRMDYANNAVGRKYAARKERREDLLGLLLSDPDVIGEADGPPR